MKHIALTSALALTTSALFAGEVPYVQAAPMGPAPAPNLWNWFAGGSVGYLLDYEEEMYTAHIGIDLQDSAYGCGQAVYLEVGYFSFDESFSEQEFEDVVSAPVRAFGVAEGNGDYFSYDADLDVIPITLNYKVECPISGPLSAYFGIGAGVAVLDLEIRDGKSKDDDNDIAFCGQIFAGLLYNASDAFEVFAGGRWIYIDDSEFFGEDVDSEDDFLVELGGRFNF